MATRPRVRSGTSTPETPSMTSSGVSGSQSGSSSSAGWSGETPGAGGGADGEVAEFGHRATAPAGVDVYNPAFDVTPAALITAIITERGVATPPFDQSRQRLMSA